MAVNLKKLAKDLSHEDEEIRILALTTVLQLSSRSLEDLSGIDELAAALEQASKGADSDVVFLARKGQNHVASLRRKLGAPAPEAAPPRAPEPPPAPPPAGAPAPGRRSREELLQVLASTQEAPALASAVSDLVRCGTPEDVPAVAPCLAHADARVRSNAVEFVARHGSRNAMLELLVPMLRDDNNRVKGTAATALGRMGFPAVVGYLERLLADRRISVRESAVYAMTNIKGPRMVDLLIKALRDPYEGIRLRAVEGLGRQKDARALPYLRPFVNDIDINICEAAESAIAFMSMEEAAPYAEGQFALSESAAPTPAEPSPAVPGLAAVPAAEDPAAAVAEADPASQRRQELRRLGALAFDRCQAGELTDERLMRLYYDGVRAREFLVKHRERAEQRPRADGDGSADAIGQLEAAVRACDEEMGAVTFELLADGRVDGPLFGEVLQRIRSLDERLKAGT